MIKLAIIGTGGMAHHHAQSFQKIKGVTLAAACDIDAQRALDFSDKYGIPHTFNDPYELIRHADVDAISNVTSDAFHAPISLAALKAGKHVLCEKPLAVDYPEARKMVAAAKKARRINMVQFSYRSSAAWLKAQELVRTGRLGAITHFEASYLQSWLSANMWGDWKTHDGWLWRLDYSKGSKGVLGDVGVHIVDFATSVAGDIARLNCRLKTFETLKGKTRGRYRLDANDSAVIHCELANGALGVIHTSRWATGFTNRVFLRVHGTKGALEIDLSKSYTELSVCLGQDRHEAAWKTLQCKPAPDMFQRFIKAIRTGKQDQPDFTRGADVQKVLDACFTSDRTGKTVRV
ncbi:MAG: Gfo/Idh/MocA family oxidoreductase [Candidatus Methylacidiphilales bacterium]|nr:Gfo/Idh/MocA family oxidoreductase [Candidatus Methylacidiphilales bacterium]